MFNFFRALQLKRLYMGRGGASAPGRESLFKGLKPILYGGREVWPLIEGGKGVSATNHASSGAWAAAGGIGTVSAVNADSYDAEGRIVPQVYEALTRRDRHEELIKYAIDGAVSQVQRAYEIASGKGAININVLWEMGGAQRVLHGVLERTKGLVTGVTCGAGMPYKLSEIAASYGVNYLPIISSARAFSALWKRAYHKAAEWLAAVVYEDPWLAGGHNGLSTPKTRASRRSLSACGGSARDHAGSGIADTVPIVMAGGVWRLDEWENWIGTRSSARSSSSSERDRCSRRKTRFARVESAAPEP